MKIVKFYMVTALVVISAILYVYEHIEIIKFNYIIKNSEIQVAQLLDHNGALRYNIARLENPNFLEKKLNSDKEVYTMPDRWHIVRLGTLKEVSIKPVDTATERMTIFDFLVPKALAQGRPAK